jgi:hypothetical protein
LLASGGAETRPLPRAENTSPLFLGRLTFFEQASNVTSDNAPAHAKQFFQHNFIDQLIDPAPLSLEGNL